MQFHKGSKNWQYLTIGFLVLVWLVSGCYKASAPLEFSGSSLGTTYSIKLTQIPSSIDTITLHSEIQDRLNDIDNSMSVFKAKSEISRFNQMRSDDWFKLSPGMFKVVFQASKISAQTDGAFDFTLGELIDLWGFGKTIKREGLPTSAEIQKGRKNSGFKAVEISQSNLAIRKKNSEIMLNLSAIAKGYAVDEVAELLERKGVFHYLVEIGGEIRTKGSKNDRRPWMVAIERPDDQQRAIQRVVQMTDSSMATSGDYRNFYMLGGRRYSHTIDPETGSPIINSMASVSVIHPSCMIADALATALMVMGFEKGFEFAKQQGLAVFWIRESQSGLIEESSPMFLRYTEQAKLN